MLCGVSQSVIAATFAREEALGDLVGGVQVVVAGRGDNFESIARAHNLGYYELVEANPGIDPDHISAGTPIIIPSQYVIPRVKREGIVVNLAELRLYYFSPKDSSLLTEPVGIGRQGWETPVSTTKVTAKQEQPTWKVPESIRTYSREQGIDLPEEVPPGPENPLGDYAMRLSLGSYLIHGTNAPGGVGRRSSAGCIRMFPEGIEQLYALAPVGTKVQIINEPIKLGLHGDDLYLEVHKPLQEDGYDFKQDTGPVVEKINDFAKTHPLLVNWSLVFDVVRKQQGIPVKVGSNAKKIVE